jgi:hypothetical protein
MEQEEQALRVTALRVTQDEYQKIADRARREDVKIGQMLRRMVRYALLNMPDYWVPPTRKATGR